MRCINWKAHTICEFCNGNNIKCAEFKEDA